jgi:hypothetical protein
VASGDVADDPDAVHARERMKASIKWDDRLGNDRSPELYFLHFYPSPILLIPWPPRLIALSKLASDPRRSRSSS